MKKLLFYLFLGFASFANAQYNPAIFTDLYGGTNTFNGVNNLFFSAKLNNQLFFNLQEEFEYKLYVTDGTVGNTEILKTVTQVLNLATFDNHVYFSFVDSTNGAELWKTDGTVAGTVLVNILGGSGIAAHDYLVVGNKLYFASGNDASPFRDQLFSLDAGSSTPVLLNSAVKDVDFITEFNGQVIFIGSEFGNTGFSTKELYKSDGTQAGTAMLKDIKAGDEGSDPRGFIHFQNKLFFSADDGIAGRELWTTDGTTAGTILFMDIRTGLPDSFTDLVAGIYNSKLYFAANDGTNGSEVWSSDGTVSGTTLFKNINPSSLSSNPTGFVTLNNKLVFLADDGTNGFELWTSDGTSQNTNFLLDINPGSGSASYALFKSNAICTDQLFFDADNGGFNIEPWVTDGTAAGTHLIEDLNPSNNSLDFETRYIYFDERIFFAANSGMGRELFVMEACANLGVETNQLAEFTIYPNPANNFINIETAAEISKIEIHSTLGQLIATYLGNNKQLELSLIKSGIYFLTITTNDNNVTTRKIIVE